MTGDKLKKVEEIYHAVLEVPNGERAAFIEESCGEDEELRREVESLLLYHQTSDHVLDLSPAQLIMEVFPVAGQGSLIDHTIGRYKVKTLLGKGGMGEVYLAEDTKLNRHVALKFLPASLSHDKSRLHRFEREAFAASALNHPNILTIHEFGSNNELHFLATEFVDGQTLRELLNQGKIGLKEVLNLAEQMASALAVAHKAGIVHRDIKPENVMVREDGLVKVLDFGLAKLIGLPPEAIPDLAQPPLRNPAKSAKKTQFTTSGVLMGTVSYMSPEQTRGRNVDHRSDIWSFGVLLYEMLAGKTPFAGETSNELIAAILKGEYLPVRHYLPNVLPELERIVERSICVKLQDRYQNINELLTDLRNLKDEWNFQSKLDETRSPSVTGRNNFNRISRLPVQQTDGFSENTTSITKLPTTSNAEFVVETIKQRKYRSTAALFALSLLLISGFIYSKYYSGYFQTVSYKTPTEPISQTRIQTIGDVLETAISPDGKLLLYTATDSKKYSLRIKQLDDNKTSTVISDSDWRMLDPTFSPDGKSIFFIAQNNPDFSGYYLYKVAIEGGTPEKIIDDVDGMVSFSPDAGEIVFRRDLRQKNESHIIIAKTDGSAERVLATRSFDGGGFRNNPVWSPDGKTIVTIATDPTNPLRQYRLFAIDVADGSITRIGSMGWRWTAHLQWISGSREILVDATDKPGGFFQFWRVSYPDGEVVKVTDDFNKYQGVSTNADGTLLATTLTRQNVDVYVAPLNQISEAKKIRSIAGTAYYGMNWTPDGKIIFSTNAGGNRDLWLMEGDGSNPRQITNDNFVNQSPTVTPDGRYIVYSSEKTGKSNIWRMNSDGTNPVRLTDGDNDSYPTVTPDGRWIIYVNSGIKKISIDGGEPVQITTRSNGTGEVSPDGKFISVQYITDQDPIKYSLAILPIDGGEPVKIFDRSLVRWEWVGDSIIYPDYQGEIVNLFSRSIKTDRITQLTNFTDDKVLDFVISNDGKQILLIRGSVSNEAVIIKNFR